MKILSVRNGFTTDHSSTSYEFLAVDKPLSPKEQAEVASRSRRARPTSRRVSFTYHGDYDIPGGWEELMEKYYDVMCSESYDWWTLAIAFNTTEERIAELERYDFRGEEDCGVDVIRVGNRVILAIYCRVDTEVVGELADVLDILQDVRERLMQGDYRPLYAVWETYRFTDGDEEEEAPPVPPDPEEGRDVTSRFAAILERV